MHEHWLRKQLTRAKQGAPLWVELADAVQEIVEQHAMPLVTRLRNLSSAFTMDEQDIDRKIGELGQFFAIRAVDYESKPIIFMQRLDEIHLKDTEYPVINTLWREFKGLSVTWQPLYAPMDQEKYPYGSVLITKESAKVAAGRYGDMFLTSRGVIRLPINELMRAHDSDEMDEVISNLIAEFKVYVEPLLPLHIVFDGTELELKYTIKEADEWLRAISETIGQDAIHMIDAQEWLNGSDEIQASQAIDLSGYIKHADFYARYDEIPIDGWTLDDSWLPFYFDDVAAVRAREMFRDDLSFTEKEELSTILMRDPLEWLQQTKREVGATVDVIERPDGLIAKLVAVVSQGRMSDDEEAARVVRTELSDIIRQHEAIEGANMTLTELRDVAIRAHELFPDELSFTEREGLAEIAVREYRELVQQTKQDAVQMMTVAERVEYLAGKLASISTAMGIIDSGEAARLIRTELGDIIRQMEITEGVKPTLTDLQDFVNQVQRTMAHDGYTLAFDVVPMDQWGLDAEKLDL